MNVINFTPETSHSILIPLLASFQGSIRVSRPRKTKLGDFRADRNSCAISVNSDLSKDAFLITLLHELAHYRVWKRFKRSVKPHGKEWKREFATLLDPFLNQGVFPKNVEDALRNSFHNLSASSCTDLSLHQALTENDPDSKKLTFVSELSPGETFVFGKKGEFKMIKKLRKRYLCLHLSSNRRFVFYSTTKVDLI